MTRVLAGDIGGTKTILCLYRVSGDVAGTPTLLEERKVTFSSGKHASFAELLQEFLDTGSSEQPHSACLGIAGPIHDQRCEATNLPWVIDAAELMSSFGFSQVRLLNDLEAAAHGMLHLTDEDFVELNPNARHQAGHKAVIAAGTGLGEAIIAWDGAAHIVMPTEGGHCDFAPNSDREDELLRFLRQRFGGHVSVERILSGDGFTSLYEFLKSTGDYEVAAEVEAQLSEGDRNAVISRFGLQGKDPLCAEVLSLFVHLYGRETGNLALKSLPHGGIFVGGGIGPKIRSAMESGEFIAGFLDKGRMAKAIQHIPLTLVLNPEAPLLGAAHTALRLQNE